LSWLFALHVLKNEDAIVGKSIHEQRLLLLWYLIAAVKRARLDNLVYLMVLLCALISLTLFI
jgi:hypothetical protein